MELKNLSITFHTNKIKECVAFYSNYYQATVTFDAGWYVTIRLESNIPIYLSFQGCDEGMNHPQFNGGTTLNILVEDVNACYEKLKPMGVSFVEEITDHEWGDRAFSIYDPIGNLVYVYSERPLHDKYKDAVKE